MLSLNAITLETGREEPARRLLDGVSLEASRGEFIGVIGPSGCGKSTLLKLIAGLIDPTEGTVRWEGRDLAVEGDLLPAELGYVPQFSLAHDLLTARECVEYATRLRVGGLEEAERAARVDAILQTVGLGALGDRRAGVLSGGQRRRLALAIETVSAPSLLLCDEVTSGLDPGSAHEMMKLLRGLSRAGGGERRVVLNVTHSLADLELYDCVVVLYGGCLVFHAPPAELAAYFQIGAPEAVFDRLAEWEPGEWRDAWAQYPPVAAAPARPPGERAARPDALVSTPGPLAQFGVVFERRLRLFARDRAQAALQLALVAGFPCLVVIFALRGLPAIRNLSLANDLSIVDRLRESAGYLAQAFEVGGLVSGLLLFQIILLTLMGSNNGALEIAGERLLVESEKLAGLSSASYLAAKCAFLTLLVTVQALWMGFFVHAVCGFPGDLFGQLAFLWLTDAALTAVCLAFSSFARSPSQASLVSIYFVGFQLPLSGAVLALPEAAAWFTRPFIAAYWSWSGMIQTMNDTRFYDLILTTIKTNLAATPTCLWVLTAQLVLGVAVAYLGCQRSSWD